MSAALAILAVIALTGFPPWVPVVRGKALSPTLRRSLYLVAASQAAQAVFVFGLGLGWARFAYSLPLATVSVPLCVWGGTLALKTLVRERIGASSIVAAVSSVVLWLLLVTFH